MPRIIPEQPNLELPLLYHVLVYYDNLYFGTTHSHRVDWTDDMDVLFWSYRRHDVLKKMSQDKDAYASTRYRLLVGEFNA